MRERGLANWALSMGRQRLGLLTLQNHPHFLQNLELPRLESATGKIDVVALDLIRDRERGVPRFNEFRRQYGLQQLTSFDDFIDPRLARGRPERAEQERLVGILREVYGQHRCDASKVITAAQLNAGRHADQRLPRPSRRQPGRQRRGRRHGGGLARRVRAAPRLRDLRDAVPGVHPQRVAPALQRPVLHVELPARVLRHLGVRWVTDNGPDGTVMEKGRPNGHEMEVSPLKRVLLRTMPELAPELAPVVNAFDPWARDRGEYYSLEWKPRKGAETDPAFREK